MPDSSDPARRTVRAVLITPSGALEVVDVDPDPAAIARHVQAAGDKDVAPRATWRAKGGSYLTMWTAKSAPQTHRNDLAQLVVEELLPPMPGTARDRIREDLAETPLAGPAVVTGYSPGGGKPGVTVPVPDVALEQIRAISDGRGVRRRQAAEREAPTTLLPVDGPVTKQLAAR